MACAVSVVWGIAGYFVLQDYEVPLTCTEEVRPHYASQAEFTQALEEYENRWCSLR